MSRRRLLNQRDIAAGAVFFVFGMAFWIVALRYPMGTTMRMGPGYFPALLGVVLCLIGAVIGLTALRGAPLDDAPARAALQTFRRLRPALLISASILLFAATVETLGLALAVFGVVVVSSMANRDLHWPHVLASGLLLSVVSVGVFAYGLRLPFRVSPF